MKAVATPQSSPDSSLPGIRPPPPFHLGSVRSQFGCTNKAPEPLPPKWPYFTCQLLPLPLPSQCGTNNFTKAKQSKRKVLLQLLNPRGNQLCQQPQVVSCPHFPGRTWPRRRGLQADFAGSSQPLRPESSNLCSTEPSCSQRDPSPTLGYPRFQDAHLRALLGFGFLLAFLSRYGVGSVAGSLLIVAFTIQWAILAQGLFYFSQNSKIYVSTQSMVSADFCTAAILISTGAVLGRVNPIQMLLMALLEVPLFACNEYVLRSLLGVSDSGGSLTIHTFGAYFGLTVSRVLHRPHKDKRKEQQDVGHQPDLFAVVGTFCLWIFWPSFASATTTHDSAEPWAVLNLYFSMAASTLATFVLSPILYEEGTLQVAQLQDATLASAAVMGMAGEMLSTPFGALTAGFLASQLSLLGSRFLSPILRSRLKTEDTCGVHNVHGLPGILGTFLGTLLAALATADVYGDRNPPANEGAEVSPRGERVGEQSAAGDG
ncbi:ammonium transporter Rh type B isoform X2 [Lagopus muta]|uniref:ammonium transporter Rh type B isoform X2 n=1 Tax=Lagopus muta TaxID=64668 RepID=UPI0020A15171|nr:ammonium transporter Rh type B isoform X2 [Lagopus muta]